MRILMAGLAVMLHAAGGGGLARVAAVRDGGRPAPADTTTVKLTDRLTYVPDTVRIAVGRTVLWQNTSLLVHTVTDDPRKATLVGSAQLPAGAQPFDSGNLKPGGRFTHTFAVPGTYHYFCVPHEAAKMRGVVIVGGGP